MLRLVTGRRRLLRKRMYKAPHKRNRKTYVRENKRLSKSFQENYKNNEKDNNVYKANNNKLYLEPINKAKSEVLNEIILSIFENQFNTYFESIPKLSKEELDQYYPKFLDYYNTHNKENPCFILFDNSYL